MTRLAGENKDSSLAALHLGWASYWAGRNADAVSAWTRAAQLQPDTPYAVDAEDALHPGDVPGLPLLVTGLEPPAAVQKLPAAQELAALARAAAKPDARAKLVYGSALWNLKRPVSAERQFEEAASLAPNDPVARTAAAVGAFTKADPVKAFGRLGPLTGAFPRAAVVRFHLGLLLLWTGQRRKAATQLRLAAADGPQTVYAKYADALLSRLGKNGS
jgi:Flp pilus assembly protein TadD